jgi:hypothetical protein
MWKGDSCFWPEKVVEIWKRGSEKDDGMVWWGWLHKVHGISDWRLRVRDKLFIHRKKGRVTLVSGQGKWQKYWKEALRRMMEWYGMMSWLHKVHGISDWRLRVRDKLYFHSSEKKAGWLLFLAKESGRNIEKRLWKRWYLDSSLVSCWKDALGNWWWVDCTKFMESLIEDCV